MRDGFVRPIFIIEPAVHVTERQFLYIYCGAFIRERKQSSI